MKKEAFLVMDKISKTFPGVEALKNVDFYLNEGEIVALVGENGAGKSTLMNILAGICTPTKGDIFIGGKRVQITNPAIARKYGIGMVHQQLTLVPNMSVAANIFMGQEWLTKGIFLNSREMLKKSEKILNDIGMPLDPKKIVNEMSMPEQEIVEISRVMMQNPRVVILDEVTSPLDSTEVEHLFRVIRKLKSSGIGIIFISHRLREVFEISDRIVILRDGQNVGMLDTKETSQEEVIRLMIGQTLNHYYARSEETSTGRTLLRVENLSSDNLFKDVNLTLQNKEILGLAGLKGSGRSELAKAIFGLLRVEKGEIYINDRKVKIETPFDAIRLGIGYIPADRDNEGLALIRSVEENINITLLDLLSNLLSFLNLRKAKENSKNMIKRLRIKTPSLKQKVMYLSGGNQQKVMIAKWLAKDPNIIIFDEPTRGIDVGSKAEIHKLLVDLRNRGKGIIVISSELPELLRLCDRILVMSEGKITAEFPRSEATEEKIMQCLHHKVG